MNTASIQIRAYNRKELAARYSCCPRTFNKWLQQIRADIGPIVGHLLSPKQVKVIVEKLGSPDVS